MEIFLKICKNFKKYNSKMDFTGLRVKIKFKKQNSNMDLVDIQQVNVLFQDRI